MTDAVRQELLKSPISNADQTVTIDLSTGTIQVDLEQIVLNAKQVTSLNSLPPNTELLDAAVVTAIVNGVTEALTGTSANSLTSKITSLLTQKIYDLQVTISLHAAVDPADISVGGTASELTNALTSIVKSAGGTVGSVTEGVGDAAQGATQAGADIVEGAASGAGGAVNNITEGIQSATEGTGPVGETAGAIAGAGGAAVEGAANTAGQAAGDVLTGVGDTLGDAGNAVGGLFQRTNVGDIAYKADTQDLTLIDIPITITGTLGGFLGKQGAAEPTIDVQKTELAGLNIGDTVLQPLVTTVQQSVDGIGEGLNTVVDQAVTKFNPTVTTTVNGLVTPLIGNTGALKTLLENLATIEVNDQPTLENPVAEGDLGAGSFTVRALNVQLLPKVANSLINIELGSATVKAADVATHTTDKLTPIYQNGAGKAGQTVTIAAPTFDDPTTATTTEATAAPTGTKFAAGANPPENTVVNPSTGEISVQIPAGTQAGTQLTVPVTVTYADQSTDTASATVTVQAADAKNTDALNPVYQPLSAPIGETTVSEAPKDENGVAFPANTKFALAKPLEWTTIDSATGKISVTPPAGTTVGPYTLRVGITYPDGSSDTINASVNVTAAPLTSAGVEPAYGSGRGLPGATVTIPAPTFDKVATTDITEQDAAPTGTSFAAATTAPTGTVVDPTTGAITVTIPAETEINTAIQVPVIVTYEDGSTDSANATVTVAEPITDAHDPQYPAVEVPTGTTVTQTPADAAGIPVGTKFALADTTKTVLPWANIDETSGVITYAPPADANLGAFTARVGITYPDGSVDTVEAPLTVTSSAKIADGVDPRYGEANGKPGETVTVDAPTFVNGEGQSVEKPEGTTFATDAAGATIDTNTGALSIEVPADATGTVEVPVVVTYTDGSTDNATVTVAVGEQSGAAVATGSTDETPAGETTKLDDQVDTNRITDASVDGVDGATVEINADGSVAVSIPAGTPETDGTVVYSDGTQSPIHVPAEGAGENLKCSAAMDEIGKIVALMVPVGLLTQLNVPGIDQLQAQLGEQFKAANTNLQQQLGIYNPEISAWVDSINAQLTSPEARRAIGGVALVIGGLRAAQLFIENCLTAPGSSEQEATKDDAE